VTILSLKDPLKYFFLFPNGIAGRLWVNKILKTILAGFPTEIFLMPRKRFLAIGDKTILFLPQYFFPLQHFFFLP